MIRRISVNGQDLSDRLETGEVISQNGRGRWRVTLQLNPNTAKSGLAELLADSIGLKVDVEVHETRGTVLTGAAFVSRFDPLTCYTELTGDGGYTRQRVRPSDAGIDQTESPERQA